MIACCPSGRRQHAAVPSARRPCQSSSRLPERLERGNSGELAAIDFAEKRGQDHRSEWRVHSYSRRGGSESGG